MNFNRFLFPTIFFFFLASCSRKRQLADPGDYNAFMRDGIIQKAADNTAGQISFWQQRLQRDTGNFVDMMELASCHFQLFKLQGGIDDLHKGDSLLKTSVAKLNNTDPEMLFGLSQNSITQHKFRESLFYTEAAAKAGGDMYTTRLLEFDASMELGFFSNANSKLGTLKDKSTFDYLIRRAKLEDHKGNLDNAIELMEQAFEKVKNGKKALYCWALSNLGDMYGHAGRIDDAYKAYLGVLQKDSTYIYALKGIAWIAYSHDQNAKEAKRIYQHILSQTNMPDLYLVLAEIEEWEGNDGKKKEYILQFIDEIKKTGYGDMYNKYLLQLYTGELNDIAQAQRLAEKEVSNRATPETFDWLAWVYFKKGEKEQAYAIARNKVNNQNFEPDAIFHTALIYAANGKKREAKRMLEDCLECSFEMGPVQTKLVEQQLRSL